MKLELLSNVFKSVKVTAPVGGYSAGDMVKVNDLIGVVVEDAAEGADAVIIYSAEKINVPKVSGSGITFSIGDKVYYNTTAKAVTNSSSGNILCGRALEDATSSATSVKIVLNGDMVA